MSCEDVLKQIETAVLDAGYDVAEEVNCNDESGMVFAVDNSTPLAYSEFYISYIRQDDGSMRFGYHYTSYDDDIEAALEEGMRKEDAENHIREIEEDAENIASLLNRTFVDGV